MKLFMLIAFLTLGYSSQHDRTLDNKIKKEHPFTSIKHDTITINQNNKRISAKQIELYPNYIGEELIYLDEGNLVLATASKTIIKKKNIFFGYLGLPEKILSLHQYKKELYIKIQLYYTRFDPMEEKDYNDYKILYCKIKNNPIDFICPTLDNK